MHDTEPNGVRLLLVEDDEGLAEMYRLQLTATGYAVSTAHTGEQALQLARDERPDLIYLDLGLPQMSGFEVLERLQAAAETAAIPVVILTNYSEPDLVERSRVLGACEFLIKAHTTPAHLTATTRKWTSGP